MSLTRVCLTGKSKGTASESANTLPETRKLPAEMVHKVIDNVFTEREDVVKRPVEHQAACGVIKQN